MLACGKADPVEASVDEHLAARGCGAASRGGVCRPTTVTSPNRTGWRIGPQPSYGRRHKPTQPTPGWLLNGVGACWQQSIELDSSATTIRPGAGYPAGTGDTERPSICP